MRNLLILLSLAYLAGCGKETGKAHGSFFPNGPAIICSPGPDAQTEGLTAVVVSEHCHE